MMYCWDLTGGPVIKSPPSTAGGASLNSGPGIKIPCASHCTTKINT